MSHARFTALVTAPNSRLDVHTMPMMLTTPRSPRMLLTASTLAASIPSEAGR